MFHKNTIQQLNPQNSTINGKMTEMINVEEELGYYVEHFMKEEESLEDEQAIWQETLFELENSIQKQTKLQQKTYLVIEEVVEQLEEMTRKSENTKKIEQDNEKLLEALMKGYDLFAEVIYGAKEQEEQEWYKQFTMQAKRLSKTMFSTGIHIIEDTEVEFELMYHKVVGTIHDPEKQMGYVINVLKPGYIYNGKVIRKAEVIVNSEKEC